MKRLSNGLCIWEQKDDDKIVDLYNRRVSLNAMADELGVRYAQLEHRLRRLRRKGLIKNRSIVSPAAEEQLEDRKTQAQTIVESITPLIKELNYYDPKPILSRPTMGPKDDRTVEEAVLVLSDIHFGKKTESFNYSVLADRFTRLHYSMARIIGLLRQGYKIDKLNVFLNGDIVDGDEIYPGHAHGIEMPVIDQIYQLGFPMLRDFLLLMTKLFKTVEVHCCYGNHGRVNKYASRKTNFDYVLYKTLESYFRDYPSIKFNVYEDWKAIVPIQGHNFLLTHGDAISGGSSGVPLTAMIGALMRWATTLDEKFEVLVTGHFHTPWRLSWTKNLTTIGNGTFVSGDDFAIRTLKVESGPAQQFFGVNKNRPITWQYTIELGNTEVPKSQIAKYRVLRGKPNMDIVPHE